MIKILVVDDSIVFRSGITQALSQEPGLNVFKAVSNGKVAVDFLKQHPDIDVITLDMEMPIMDGLETIKEIRKFNKKVVIIVFSALTVRGAEATIDALTHGANDFVPKVESKGTIEDSLEMIRRELMPKIRAFSAQRGQVLKPTILEEGEEKDKSNITHQPVSKIYSLEEALDTVAEKPQMILIGSSTGGPDALKEVFTRIKVAPKVPIFLVQHMPPIFTTKLADALNMISGVKIKEAEDHEFAQPGVCYIAPGDYHMTIANVSGQMRIRLNKDEKVCFVRPSADVLFESCAKNFEGPFVSIVLTGMGRDGTNGAIALNTTKHYLFIQDKESSAVWGMAGSIDKENIGARTLQLKDIGTFIERLNT